ARTFNGGEQPRVPVPGRAANKSRLYFGGIPELGATRAVEENLLAGLAHVTSGIINIVGAGIEQSILRNFGDELSAGEFDFSTADVGNSGPGIDQFDPENAIRFGRDFVQKNSGRGQRRGEVG